MGNELAMQSDAQMMETVLIGGDLSKLTAEQKLSYYKRLCESLGLNPLSKPFGYIQLNGKLTLYALKDCTEQMRNNRGVSVVNLDGKVVDDLYIVTATGKDAKGRTDCATGAVNIKGLFGEHKANAIMKAETKAKRRLTLSLCGLGMLDETEVSSVPDARVIEEAEINVNTGTPTATAKPAEYVPPTAEEKAAQDAAVVAAFADSEATPKPPASDSAQAIEYHKEQLKARGTTAERVKYMKSVPKELKPELMPYFNQLVAGKA